MAASVTVGAAVTGAAVVGATVDGGSAMVTGMVVCVVVGGAEVVDLSDLVVVFSGTGATLLDRAEVPDGGVRSASPISASSVGSRGLRIDPSPVSAGPPAMAASELTTL